MAIESKDFQVRDSKVSVIMDRPSYGRPGADVSFIANSSIDLTREDIKMIQENMGYHPMGYGFWNATVKQDERNGLYVTSWKCASTCD